MRSSHPPPRRKRRGWWQPGNITTGNIAPLGPPVGVDVGGVWRDWALAVNSGGTPWAGADDVGRWIDPALSEGFLGGDAIGSWMEV